MSIIAVVVDYVGLPLMAEAGISVAVPTPVNESCHHDFNPLVVANQSVDQHTDRFRVWRL